MTEIELLKQEVIEDLFEEKYFEKNEEFISLINTYTTYRGDEKLKELVLKIYNYIQSAPFPKKWLREKVEMFNLKDKLDVSFEKTAWGSIIFDEYKNQLIQNKLKLQGMYDKLIKFEELSKFSMTLQKDTEKLQQLQEIMESNQEGLWDKTFDYINNLEFDRWPADKKCVLELKNEAKQIRDEVKNSIKELNTKFFVYNSEDANKDINSMYKTLHNLEKLINEFSAKFQEMKKEKNIIDFHDIEHFALEILYKQDEKGEYKPSEVADKIKEKYEEIAIDEYQDSNMVQEFILNSISNGNNIFMVGDVKQSIYRFRQARPDLFLKKYQQYELIEENTKYKYGKKIQLFKNFRSRENILDLTNMMFEQIMTQKLGEMDYTKEEFLNLGADYEKLETENNYGKAELHIIDLENDNEEKIWKTEENEETDSTEQEQNEEPVENTLVEARFVANKIEEILKSGYIIFDKKQGYRKATYKDIVILLRATANAAPIYEKELIEKNIPVFSDSSAEYLESNEIQTIMSVLKIINNPLNDIALITVLRSSIGNFTDNDLVEIRLFDRNENFYNAMLKARISANDNLRNKIDYFINNLEKWRNDQEILTLDELIWEIYIDSNYYNYVGCLSNGNLRQANLRMLFEKAGQYEKASYKGLYNFINFIDKVKTNSKDMQAAKIIGENENVVRIMSIHKSKGLEFPIVFLGGCAKQFNLMDLNSNILMHQDLGFGPKYINFERRIEYNTLAKEALKIRLANEMIAEEMRILYVALTRAREKLYITGVEKNYKKSIKEKEKLLTIYNEEKVNPILLKKYKSYLNWIELVCLNRKKEMKNLVDIYVHKYKDFDTNSEKNQNNEDLIKLINNKIEINNGNKNKEKIDEIKRMLDWKYEYIDSITIPTKTSVSKIKNNVNTEQGIKEFLNVENDNIENDDIEYNLLSGKQRQTLSVPKMYKEEKITGAQKGTLIHLCMQHLDENKNYTYKDIQELVENLVFKRIITNKEAKAININSILQFTKSEIFMELSRAKKVFKEKPFYINLPANEIYNTKSDDYILIQGIIDLYYIDENNKIVLVDYKTDYVEDENDLIKKYKEQLNLYKKAIEKASKQKVEKVIIYSTYLNKQIKILE